MAETINASLCCLIPVTTYSALEARLESEAGGVLVVTLRDGGSLASVTKEPVSAGAVVSSLLEASSFLLLTAHSFDFRLIV